MIKKYFRSLLIIISFICFGIGAMIISFIIFPSIAISKKNDADKRFAYANIIHKTWKIFVKAIEKIDLVKINCPDKKLLSELSGKVIVANHPTLIDIIILIGLIPKSTCLAKKETLKNPFFKNIVKSIYISNDTPLDIFKEETAQFIKEGYNIIIFPSGTRTKKGEHFKIHNGPAVIALHSNTQIIPIKIETDYPFLQKHQPIYEIENEPVNFDIKVKQTIDPSAYVTDSEVKTRKHINNRIKEEII